MSSSAMSRKETERTKLIQEKCQTLLTQMLRDEDNKYCVDCDAKGPRWASWNLGVFLCIRCAGIHRNLGVHISRVKSVNLDTWTPEQVISLQQMGNSRARAVYEAQLPDGFRRPQTDTALESFIRAKYEHKKYLAREWVPPSPPKVDWAKEIDEELEKQKRKKKAAQASSVLGINVLSGTGDKKPIHVAKSTPLPAPLPKPKPGQSGGSPKTQRTSASSTGGDSNQTNDLLGLSSPTKPVQNSGMAQDLQNDNFSSFLSATPISNAENKLESNALMQNTGQNSLAKDEEDFFNQGSLGGGIGDKDKSGKLTKDSILALYGTAPSTVGASHSAQIGFGQPFAVAGISPSYIGAAGNPHPQQQQFMTPPNSASMYNAPVMTAPTAFTTPGLNMHMGAGAAGSAGFAGQFPVQGLNAQVASGFSQQMPGMGMMSGSSINRINYMQSNQNLLSGISMLGAGPPINQSQPITSAPIGSMQSMGTLPTATAFQTPGASSTGNLTQQFGNLNIGNVWQ